MKPWLQILTLAVGGALGVNARYWLAMAIDRRVGPGFPWATFAINVSGSLAIGFAAVILAQRLPHPAARLLVITGFLGGYTTFSTFAYEPVALWQRSARLSSLGYLVASAAAGVAAVVLGAALARSFVGPPPPGAPAVDVEGERR